jgi:NADP-dependent 3-hydroxy acid dehydrogenase YdfG
MSSSATAGGDGARPATIVVGAGPGIGLAVARRFAVEGHSIGLVARSATTLAGVESELGATGVATASETADVRDEPA